MAKAKKTTTKKAAQTHKNSNSKKPEAGRASTHAAKHAAEHTTKHVAEHASKHAAESATKVTMDRRASGDRRKEDRRKVSIPVAVERRKLQRRAKVARRRQIDPTTCERDYSADEVEFMSALDDYKRTSGRMFPTCSEILEVLRKLGYEKRLVEEPVAPEETSHEFAAPAAHAAPIASMAPIAPIVHDADTDSFILA